MADDTLPEMAMVEDKVVVANVEERAPPSRLLDSTSGYPVACFVQPPPEFLICCVCHEVARDPPNLEMCGHIVCRECLKRNESRVCPNCRASYDTNDLRPMPLIKRMVSTLAIRCPFVDSGCTWTGMLGTDDRVINEHLQVCSHSVFKKCGLCDEWVQGAEMDDGTHDRLLCNMRQVQCPHCDEKMIARLLPVHKILSGDTSDLCCNRRMCRFAPCTSTLAHGQEQLHAQTECKGQRVVCTACSPAHIVVYGEYRAHLEGLAAPLLAVQAVQQARQLYNGPKDNREPWICEPHDIMMARPKGKPDNVLVQVLEVLEPAVDNNDSSEEDDDEPGTKHRIRVRELETGEEFITRVIERADQLNRQSPAYNHDVISIPPAVREALLACQCTYMGENMCYEAQPMYMCRTCDPLPYSDKGCCATCAVTCHAGHRLTLDMSSSFYCDCGAGALSSNKCRAAKRPGAKITQTESDEETDNEAEVVAGLMNV